MFTTIQECLALYKKELTDYRKWEKYGENLEWEKIHSWKMNLKGMEQALGLTVEEANAIWDEIGLSI